MSGLCLPMIDCLCLVFLCTMSLCPSAGCYGCWDSFYSFQIVIALKYLLEKQAKGLDNYYNHGYPGWLFLFHMRINCCNLSSFYLICFKSYLVFLQIV